MERTSISFDRAAEYYDRTRALSPETMAEVVALLRAELEGRQPCLEIGVGTGRLGLPLHESGIRMAGVDLSLPMILKLREKAGGRAPFPVVVADALALPFRDHSFGAGLAVHVLHVIGDSRAGLAELVRVVRPKGVVLVDAGGWGRGWWRQIQDRFCEEAGIPPRGRGLIRGREIDEIMASFGARVRRLGPIRAVEWGAIEERISRLEEGLYSFTWQMDDRSRREAARKVRAWAMERFGSLSEPRRSQGRIGYRAYDLP